jgi:hypothetical protein
MVDFGLALFSNVTIINAAREGARLGVTLTPAELSAGTKVEGRVMSMSTGLDPAKVSVTSTCIGSCSPAWSSGDSVKVNVAYTYSMVWPLTFGTSIPLASSVEMRIE